MFSEKLRCTCFQKRAKYSFLLQICCYRILFLNSLYNGRKSYYKTQNTNNIGINEIYSRHRFYFRCRHPGCQKAFSQLSNLQSHSRCHQTDKPYKCNSCYKCFSDEPSLLEHIPKHKESKHLKTHICQYCGKSYTQETYLSKHMQKHAERTDKRPPIGPTLGE